MQSPERRGAGPTPRREPSARSARTRASARVLAVCLALFALRMPVAEAPDLLDPPGRLLPLWPQSLLWLAMGALALGASRWGYRHLQQAGGERRVFAAGRRQPDVEADPRSPTLALVLFVAAVLSAVIIPPLLVGGWTLQPVELWLGLYGTYGTSVAVATTAWVIFHTGYAILSALILALAQLMGESLIRRVWTRRAPLGGLALGLLLGIPDLLLWGWADLLTTVISCTLLGLVHLLVGGRLRWTAAAAWLLLMLL